MHVSPAAEALALVLTVLVHFVGAGVLIWGMLGDERPSLRGLMGDDDSDGGGGTPPPTSTPPAPRGGDGIELLPDSSASDVRLREGGQRIGAGRQPKRRPEHPREPVREPAER